MQKPLRQPLRARSKRCGGDSTGCLLGLRPSRRRLVPLLALLCYFFVGAIVPQGHMAAALAGGTAFHWCPGDLRSAQIIDALSAFAAQAHRHRHHHHHHAGGHELDAAAPHSAAHDKSSADPGCPGAGPGAAAANAAVADTAFDDNDSTPRAAPGASAPRRLWWRPTARSPPV